MQGWTKTSQRAQRCKRCTSPERRFYWYKNDTDGRFRLFDMNDIEHVHHDNVRGNLNQERRSTITTQAQIANLMAGGESTASETTASETTASETTSTMATPSVDQAALSALHHLLGGLSAADVTALVKSELDGTTQALTSQIEDSVATLQTDIATHIASLRAPTVCIVRDPVKLTEVNVGQTHALFPNILRAIQRKPVMLVGPAGTGKTSVASQVAEALGVPFYPYSMTEDMMRHDLVGFEAADAYRSTFMRQAFDSDGPGGLVLFDEFDHANPNCTGVVNSALANGVMGFPDRIVTRHARFYCMCAGNTFGTGPDRKFVGANKMDFAFLDRFIAIPFGVDESIEDAMVAGTGLEPYAAAQWLTFVRAMRARAQELNMPVDFTPRSSLHGAELLADGETTANTVAWTVRKGISDADWHKLTEGIKVPTFKVQVAS